MKVDDKDGFFGWKATESPNFSLTAFFVDLRFECKVGKILLAVDRRRFWIIFGKI